MSDVKRGNIFIALLVAITCWLLLPIDSHAEETHLSLQEEIDSLYSTRIRFDKDGLPQITVGIMEGQRSLTITPECDAELVYYTPKRQHTTISKGSKVSFRMRNYTKGTERYMVVVKKLSWREKGLVKKLVAQWQDRGYAVEIRKTGGIQGLSGVLVDTRQYLILVGSFESRYRAQALANEIYRIFRIRASVLEELTQRPHGTIVISIGSKKLAESNDLVWIRLKEGCVATTLRKPRHTSYERGKKAQRRRYRGVLYGIIDRKGGMTLGNMLNIEQMLESVVPAEIFSSAPMEALKAQAVAARNQLLVNLGTKHLADPFVLCDTQHCQVMGGADSENERTHKAIEATRGLFLFDKRGLVNTYYSADSGGFTEDSETHWPGRIDPALRGKYDGTSITNAHDQQFVNGITEKNIRAWLFSPPEGLYVLKTKLNRKYFRWKRTFTASQINRMVAAKFHNIGAIRSIEAIARGVSGRIKVLKVSGSKGSVILQNPYEIRQLFGGLPSSMFIIETIQEKNGTPKSFIFHGGGWGHGVGMCQTGAIGRAMSGQDFITILKHYYSNSTLKRLYK